jgi:hypothetical protein
MTELEKLEGYFNHLKANAGLLGGNIGTWETWSSSSIKQAIAPNEIEKRLRRLYNELSKGSDRAGQIISGLLKRDYSMSSLMTYEQWWRNKQLNKII